MVSAHVRPFEVDLVVRQVAHAKTGGIRDITCFLRLGSENVDHGDGSALV